MADESTSSHRLARSVYIAGLVFALGLAGWVRFYDLGGQDFWLDEIFSLISSAGRFDEWSQLPYNEIVEHPPHYWQLTQSSDWSSVWGGQRADIHPPLYFALLQSWRRMLGTNEWCVRLLPTLFSLLTFVPVLMLFRRYLGRQSMFWYVVLMAVAYVQIDLGRENRPYSMAQCLVCFSFWLVDVWQRRWETISRRGRVGIAVVYGGLVTAAVLTHYLAVFALLAQLIFALIKMRGRCLRAWLVTVVFAAGVFLIEWGPGLWHQMHIERAGAWLGESSDAHVQHSLIRLANIPIRLVFHCMFGTNLSGVQALWGVLLVAGPAIILFWKRPPGALLFGLWYALPLLAIFVIDVSTSRGMLGHIRYGYLALPGLLGLILLANQSFHPRIQPVVPIVMSVVVWVVLVFPVRPTAQCQAVAAAIRQDQQPNTLLVYAGTKHLPEFAMTLFLGIDYYAPDLGCPVVLLNELPSRALRDKISQYSNVVVLNRRREIPLASALGLEQHTYLGSFGDYYEIGAVHVFQRMDQDSSLEPHPDYNTHKDIEGTPD